MHGCDIWFRGCDIRSGYAAPQHRPYDASFGDDLTHISAVPKVPPHSTDLNSSRSAGLSSFYSNGSKGFSLMGLVAAAVVFAAPAQASEIAETAVEASPAVAVRTIAFSAPIVGYETNSRFGLRRLSFERRARMHEGLDYAAPSGTPILAAADGEVIATGTSSSYGRYVEIRHANGVTSFYAHMSRIGAEEGQIVTAGEQIGAVGSTGRSTGPHLHFEIRRDGEQINPEDFLGRSFALQDVAPEAEGGWDAPAFFASAPVAFGPFRTLTPAFQP